MAKISQLVYNENTERYELDGRELHCGDSVEVLVVNGLSGKAEWVETRLEYNDFWYLDGLFGYQISGLFARL